MTEEPIMDLDQITRIDPNVHIVLEKTYLRALRDEVRARRRHDRIVARSMAIAKALHDSKTRVERAYKALKECYEKT